MFKKMMTALGVVVLLTAINPVFSAPTFQVTDVIGNDTGELKFDGKISPSCNLQNFVDGTVVANLSQTQVSSLLSGGSAASVSVRSNTNGFSLILGVPYLVAPSGNIMNDVTFNMNPVGNGFALDGTARPEFYATNGVFLFDSGIYDITVNALAQRNKGAFEAGAYQLKVPVSCVKV
jgi:hypothetical protein